MIKSVRHATSNEDGMEELSIEREFSTLEYLTAAAAALSFRIPTVIAETWVMKDGVWVDKTTGLVPSHDQQGLIRQALELIKIQSMLDDPSFEG